MTKITRKDTQIFSETAANVNQFGSTRDGAAIPSKNPDVLQGNPAFTLGWNEAVIEATDNPPEGEFNALSFLHSRALKYLEEQTLVEYTVTTTYFIDSIARTPAGTTLYKSVIDSNINYDIEAIAYNAGTTYEIGDVAADANGDIYRSLTAGNIGNPLTDPVEWELTWVFLGDLESLKNLAQATEDTAGIVERLTNLELAAGIDTTRYPSAANLLSLFNLGDQAETGSFNLPINIAGAFDEKIIKIGKFNYAGVHTAFYSPVFSSAFSTACQNVVYSTSLDSISIGVAHAAARLTAKSTTGFTFQHANDPGGGAAAATMYYVAIGY